jgi:ankyrin repeat protein
VRRLAALGVDANAEGLGGVRPLHSAAHNGHVEAMRTLVELGADVHAAAADGRRPLHYAAVNGHVKAMRALVELGADVHAHRHHPWKHCAPSSEQHENIGVPAGGWR